MLSGGAFIFIAIIDLLIGIALIGAPFFITRLSDKKDMFFILGGAMIIGAIVFLMVGHLKNLKMK